MHTGSWRLVENGTQLAGESDAPHRFRNFSARGWHTLALGFAQNGTAALSIDGQRLGSFGVAARSGMVGLATGWNEAQFDAVDTRPLPLAED